MMKAFRAKALHLNLVQKVVNELDNHEGIKDKDVAEFVIDMAKKAADLAGFRKNLKDNGADFEAEFVETLWLLVERMTPASNLAHKVERRSRDEFKAPAPRGPQMHPDRRKGTQQQQRQPRRDVIDAKPLRYKIYNGIVKSVKEYGCFIELQGIRDNPQGLCGREFIVKGNTNPKVSSFVKRGQRVKAKVISVFQDKIALSMSAVDQATGEDLRPRRNAQTKKELEEQELRENPSRPSKRMRQDERNEDRPKTRRKKLSAQEMWEMNQIRGSGVLTVEERDDYDEQTGVLPVDVEPEEDLDIELNEHEPAFLKGKTSTSINLSPIRVVKNPDGSLQRAALTQSALAKERREMREQQFKSEIDAIPTQISKPWQDPISNRGDQLFAEQLRMLGKKEEENPMWQKMTGGRNLPVGMLRVKSMKEQRESLPIYKFRSEIVKAVDDHQMLIVVGETGSGKTTQMTQYFAEHGYASNKRRIGCTQPRRVAAMSVAKRVAEEYGCRLGQEVGYSIRFEDCTSADTMIKYMTDGMLLREALMDPDMSNYNIIMLDEAHERTINTDVLFGLLKECCERRRDLKLVITSATLNATKFSNYFNKCPIFHIPGRLYPVTVKYLKQPEPDYLDAALLQVLQIHLSEPPGDILVFLTGKEEIDTACQILYERVKKLKGCPELMILPVYSALPSEMQTRIFEPTPAGSRKCVVATNIAEASLTIDGIYYVIDPGFVKQQVYNPKLRMNSLVITPISQNSAKQRAGRAGRTGPGSCYRLYTQAAYHNEMLPSAVPEIQRTNMSNTVLTLKAMGIQDLLKFDFMDRPHTGTLITAMQQLYNLGALDDEGLLTRLGRKMAEFPLEPQLSKILLASSMPEMKLMCAEEALTVVSMLQAENIWFRPREKQAIADQRRAHFFKSEGDHITLLNVYRMWQQAKYSNPWCMNNFIQTRAMRMAMDVRKQLVAIMDRYSLPIRSAGKDVYKVQKAFASGYFMHSAKKDPQEGYKTLVEGQPSFIHPSSALFNHQPEWLIYHKLVLTSKEYMRECMVIEPKWLVELAPRFYRKADPVRLSRRKRRERIEPLYDRYAEPGAWRLSRNVF